MLNSLTNEQKKLLPIIRDKWITKLNSLPELNIEETTKFINWVYELINLPLPKIIVLDSPLAIQYYINISKQLPFLFKTKFNILNAVRDEFRDAFMNDVGNSVNNAFWDAFMNDVGDAVRNEVMNAVMNDVGDAVRNEVRNEVRDEVRNAVRNAVRNEAMNAFWDDVMNDVGNAVRDEVRGAFMNDVGNAVMNDVGNAVNNAFWDDVMNEVGNAVMNEVRDAFMNDVGDAVRKGIRKNKKMIYYSFSYYLSIYDYIWVSFYDYFDSLGLNIIKNKKFITYRNFVEKSNIFLSVLFEKKVIVSKMPIRLTRDENKKMHNVQDSAIKFADGYELFYIHGIHFKKEDFTKFFLSKPKAKEILAIKNQEQKAVVIQHYGFGYVINQLENVHLLDEYIGLSTVDGQKRNHKLYSFVLDNQTYHLLECEDYTDLEVFYLLVPTDCQTALNAKAWTFSMTEEEYLSYDLIES
jgi:hypothetical protein